MSTKKILLVDDSCTGRLVNRMIFSQKSNYVLISAVDGKEAVEKAKRGKPDLILMDMLKARMTGLEDYRVVKKGRETEKTLLSLLTTRAGEKQDPKEYPDASSVYLSKTV